ncbi:NAD(P)-dependent oxidoreductase [Chitinasiproducens palmae]|uniref:Gluconate 2-dehydrogenase n=1 Tax=Chitinasiproducens palmae TaxID=1770053 RepID=A0A1H2PJ93_9BURK|nr:NAD(P)-dependent oxidoreductase [Chitinasiproducens palmae]SDV46406.1 gluconate 2-dehydrogenase [Chitinasiproducens palmae]
MKPRILIYRAQPDAVEARLAEHFSIERIDGLRANPDALADALAQVDGALGSSVAIGAAELSRATRLRAIATVSVGIDKFDLAALDARHVVLSHTPDVLTETTADTVFALVLATARRVVELADYVRAGRWQKSIGAELYGVDVHHKTIGIIGLGRIGQAVARRAALGFGMKVLYHGRHRDETAERTYGARLCSLDTLLGEADFVCLQVPLTDATRGMIGSRELSLMKPDAILINASRGAVIDEAALIAALTEGRVRAAGLDVFEHEPVSADSALLRLPNVVPLPHIGSATEETRVAMAMQAADNLIAALIRNELPNTVNPAAWAKR